MAKRNLHNILFPKQHKILTHFSEDLLLAMKRRNFTKKIERSTALNITRIL